MPFPSKKPTAAVPKTPVASKSAPKSAALNSRTGQPPVESPPGLVPSDKPAPPGAEPKLLPEAEAARKGGIMARVAPAPPGVLAEQPDPRASYQVGPSDDNSPLIKLTAAKATPKPAASGIDVGSKSEKPEAVPTKPEAKAIPPTAKPSAVADKESM